MKDILGRKLKLNDLVLGMTIGRHSDGIRFGVFNGESVDWSKHDGRYLTTSVMNNMYLLENPTEKELEIKQKILALVEKERLHKEETLAKRKALARIPTKDLIVGKSYVDDRGYKYVYLGKGIVTDNYTRETKEGYIYLSSYNTKQYDSITDTFNYLPSYTVLKNPKKLVSALDEDIINYTFDKQEFTLKTLERSSYYFGSRQYSLTFKLG